MHGIDFIRKWNVEINRKWVKIDWKREIRFNLNAKTSTKINSIKSSDRYGMCYIFDCWPHRLSCISNIGEHTNLDWKWRICSRFLIQRRQTMNRRQHIVLAFANIISHHHYQYARRCVVENKRNINIQYRRPLRMFWYGFTVIQREISRSDWLKERAKADFNNCCAIVAWMWTNPTCGKHCFNYNRRQWTSSV